MKKSWKFFSLVGMLLMVLVVPLISGCSAGEAVVTDTDVSGASTEGAADVAMDPTTELALGILRLEETDQAVSSEQAAALLPLWQALQGGALEGDAETGAVLAQIEGAMTEAQLVEIAAMQLTGEDVQAWMQDAGIEPGAAFAPGQAGEGEAQALSEEDREARRAEFENLSEEERAAMREQFGGQGGGPGMAAGESPSGQAGAPPAAPGGARAGGVRLLYQPLIQLLTERASE